MDRRTFIKTSVAATVGGGLSAVAKPEPRGSEMPNVLIILADQWRFSAFGYKGDPNVRTPAFDKLATEGTDFTRSYSNNPVCSPNRSTIISSRYSTQHGVVHNNIQMPDGITCLADVFSKGGYRTHYIGKWHIDGDPKPGYVPKNWRRHGFQTFEGFNRGHYYPKPKAAKYFTDDGKLVHPDEYEPHYQTNLAIDFMKKNSDNPFLCYLSWGPPHMPYKAPPQFNREKNDNLRWRPNVPQSYRDNKKKASALAGYYNLCESLDAELARLMRYLDQSGLAENTIVVFSSDHGDMHGSHNLQYKSKPEEESLHIPLVMRWPGKIKAGAKIETLSNSIDIMPTIIGLCGLEPPATVMGNDFSTALRGGKAPEVKSVYTQGSIYGRDSQWRCIVTEQYKLALYGDGKTVKLFDLKNDRYEMKNLANDPQHSALLKDMRQKLMAKASEIKDPFPQLPPTV